MKATVLKIDGTSVDVVPRNKKDFQLDELQGIVGGFIEILYLSKTQIMVVNEEGKLDDLPYNHLATLACHMAGIRDVIVGNVLVCDTKMVK